MDRLIKGETDKDIAFELNISQRVVSFHRLNVLKKMELGSIVELAATATRFNS